MKIAAKTYRLLSAKDGKEAFRGTSRECALFVMRNTLTISSQENVRIGLLQTKNIANKSYNGFQMRNVNENKI